ncbi:MAG: phosphatidylglycerophosphatase A [Desulfobacterales bacterium]|nr:phosphatidylglycerophosphatase A [Desulfobacterales bacterium]
MTTLIMAIASGLYSGYLPIAPGTWGSLVGIALFVLLSSLSLPVYGLVVAGLLLVGFFAANGAEKILDKKDPGVVVIDEIVGMLITMTAAPITPWVLLLGFLLFRLFDIAKPFPCNWVDKRVNGGIGIMLDDVIAGIYGFIVLQGILYFIQG